MHFNQDHRFPRRVVWLSWINKNNNRALHHILKGESEKQLLFTGIKSQNLYLLKNYYFYKFQIIHL